MATNSNARTLLYASTQPVGGAALSGVDYKNPAAQRGLVPYFVRSAQHAP